MTEIGTRAATSAAGAYSSTVVIPFIGPVAAPAAAALALAAVLGFGALISARGGQGEVGTDGQLTQLHKKEMVLPAWIAEPLRQGIVSARGNSSPLFGQSAAAGMAARGEMNQNSQRNANFYYQPQHHNMGADMDTLLKRDGASLRRWLRNEARNGGGLGL
jgi:ABC-type Co2+ transport system permease subunit